MSNYPIHNFQANGFALIDQPVVALHYVDKAKQQIAQIKQGIFDTGLPPTGMMEVQDHNKIQRITHIHAANNAFFDLLTQADIGKKAAEILNASKVKVWGSQLYIKPPHSGEGGHVGWHRDAQHMPHLRGDILIAWLALDEVTTEAGCLKYIQGSHQPTTFATPKGGSFQDLEGEAQRLAATQPTQKWQEVNVLLPKGGVSFHHWNLIHGSGSNVTDQARVGLSIGLAGEHFTIADHLPDYGLKDILHHPLYCPVIYDKKTETQPGYVGK